jgi:hypothetical protein
LDTSIVPVATAELAASTGDVYQSASAFIGNTPEATMIRALLVSHGFHQDAMTRTKTKRYYKRRFAVDGAMVDTFVGLRRWAPGV